jgi:choline kinase
MNAQGPPKLAVVIAAGMGRRLAPFTDAMPKCLVPVAGQPMLVRAIAAFRQAGIERVVVIRGYKAEVLEARKAELGPGVSFVENPGFASNNILQSLFTARAQLAEPLLFSYSDIVFDAAVVRELVAHPAPDALVVDTDFAAIYEGRDQHPLDEAEVCAIDAAGKVTTVGKRALPAARAAGEFIGLGKLSAAGVHALVETYDRRAAELAPDSPYGRNTWRGAYLTDLLEDAMAGGLELAASTIRGRWREIDTTQDLARAETAVTW